MPSFSIAAASARMPSPDVFSERKSSSMMTIGKRNFIGVPVLGRRRDYRAAGKARIRDTRAGTRGGSGSPTPVAAGGTLPMDYPRDLVGYGRDVPHADWPGGARIAVQFVLNYEEGGENSVLHGDAASEQFLSEIIGAAAYPARHLSMESIYEYGSRAGVWRLLREFERRKLPLTVFGVSMALERNPDVTAAFVDLGHEIACHGWRWIHYQNVDEATEREHMRIGVEIIRRMTGRRAARLVHRSRQPEHAPARRRARRLPLRRRLLRRRPAVLDATCDDSDGSTRTAPDRSLHARLQRHALRDAAGLQHRRAVLRLPARTRSTCSTPRAPSGRR